MRKKPIAIAGSAVICAAAVVSAFAAQAGSSDDPLASKSYVDGRISEVLSVLNANQSSQNQDSVGGAASDADKEKLKAEIISELSKEGSGALTAGGESYAPVYASVGQIVLGGEGTEMILRSGKADVYITGVAGIVNATTGSELTNGSKAALNNIMIIPRGDGRGFKVTENAWFLIKGDYEIK